MKRVSADSFGEYTFIEATLRQEETLENMENEYKSKYIFHILSQIGNVSLLTSVSEIFNTSFVAEDKGDGIYSPYISNQEA